MSSTGSRFHTSFTWGFLAIITVLVGLYAKVAFVNTESHKSLGQHNAEHFDNVASSAYEVEWVRKLAKQITVFLQDNTEWLGVPAESGDRELKLLDYACGNGIYSKVLAPYVTKLRGIDISGRMIEEYNATAQSVGLSPEQMRGVQGDLLDDESAAKLQDPEFFGFDIVIMSMALHHVEDTRKMIRKFAERLAPGGTVLIIDWVTPSESGCRSMPLHNREKIPMRHTIAHMGFTKQEMLDMFSQAGLVDGEVKWLNERSEMPEHFGGPQQLFFARAKKPSA